MGLGLLTVGVGSAAAVLGSDFESGTQGWRVEGDSGRAAPAWLSKGGSPGAYIRATDSLVTGTMYWDAPARYLGDMSGFFGGTLAMSMRQSATTNQFDDPRGDVVLSGGGKTISTQLSSHPRSDWLGFAVRFDPTRPWAVEPADTPASAQDIVDVLADVGDFKIRADYRVGADTDSLDSVRLTDGNRVSVSGGILTFEAGQFDTNIVVITDSGGSDYEVRDPTGLLAAGPGCAPVSNVEASCAEGGVTEIAVRTRDQRDTVTLEGVGIDSTIDGGARDDRLEGGDGGDTIIGGPGEDRLLGHAGNDTLDALDGVGDARINCDGGHNDAALADPSDPTPIDCESVNR